MKEIVIKISEDAYDYLINTHFVENTKYIFNQSAEDRKHTMQLFEVIDAVKNGIPLPKGHGRLIDADKLPKCCSSPEYDCYGECENCSDYVVYVDDIKKAPTIIEGSESE